MVALRVGFKMIKFLKKAIAIVNGKVKFNEHLNEYQSKIRPYEYRNRFEYVKYIECLILYVCKQC